MGDVTIKEYIDARIAAQDKVIEARAASHDKAVEVALAALNGAASKDEAKLNRLLSIFALLVSIGTFVFLVTRH
jgi:hypothetical protein